MTRTRISVAVSSMIALSFLSGCSNLQTKQNKGPFDKDEYKVVKALLNHDAQAKAQLASYNSKSRRSRGSISSNKNRMQITPEMLAKLNVGTNSISAGKRSAYLQRAARKLLPEYSQSTAKSYISSGKRVVYIEPTRRHFKTSRAKVKDHFRYDSTWKSLYAGFKFHNYNYKPRVKKALRQFRKPALMQRLAERSTTFLPTIVAEVKRRGLPTELAMLPFVESGFKPTAYSHASAAGLWQFIPATGKRYGLKQQGRYDGRYDPISATEAALDYLTDLHNEFGDWFLALAAYNCGEGRVAREIARNKKRGLPTDFWHLSLPKETKHYVPKLLAYKEIFKAPQTFGFYLPYLPTAEKVVELTINKQLDLREVAKRSGLPENTLTRLNRGYKSGITMPRLSKRVLVPRQYAGKIHRIMINMKSDTSAGLYYASNTRSKTKKYTKKRYSKKVAKVSKTKSHRVRSGETLFRIATRYGMSVKKLMRINRLRTTRIKTGMRLRIA